MTTAILHPQDCLTNGLRHRALILSSAPLKTRRNPNSYPHPNPNDVSRSGRRRRNSVGVQSNRRNRSGDSSAVAKPKLPVKNLVMGQVKILKRGEFLAPEIGDGGAGIVDLKDAESESGLGSTDRLGPDPDLMQKEVVFTEMKVVDGIYAGSGAFFASPPPSSVPVPSFLGKNGSATTDLRRLLGLDLD